ncbi:MAG: hypothetical protein AAGH76_09175 [Pseudomonadota bacterium]
MSMPISKVVVVTRETELDELVRRFNTKAQAKFYLQQGGHSFADIQRTHDSYQRVVGSVIDSIPREQKIQRIDRALIPRFTFGSDELVITIGQDGLVSNTAKYLSGQPIFAVNPAPERFDGVLLPFDPDNFSAPLHAALHGEMNKRPVTLARAHASDGQELLAFNDFFIGAKSHVSARYEIRIADRTELHSSSGVIVSTGAGSTGWLQSVYAGAAGVVATFGGKFIPPPDQGRLPWDTDQLIYSVREPFPSQTTQCSLVHGRLSRASPLTLSSRMPSNGVIFSDGIESDYLAFNSGQTLTIEPAARQSILLTH